jgi:Site-specific DNA methylase
VTRGRDVVVPDTPPPLIELCASRVVTPTPDAMIVCEPCEEAVVSDVPPSSGPASEPCGAVAAVDASVSVVPPRASSDVRPGRNDLITLLPSPIPSGGKRLLHLFSGLTNRPGSLGWVARTLGYECADIDILNHPDHDVLHHDLEVEIVDSILSGRVTAVMLGTPCNTFSVARMHDDGGPEQLRSLRYPHGIPGISIFGRKAARSQRSPDSLLYSSHHCMQNLGCGMGPRRTPPAEALALNSIRLSSPST